MSVSVKPTPYLIPEYSLTGDLLSYLVCGLAYRYQNKGQLPPATPVQQWFGEFIHGVMELGYEHWRKGDGTGWPWDWRETVRPLELMTHRRLVAQGLFAPPNLFCPFEAGDTRTGFCDDKGHPHKLIASRRAELALNTWGAHLFPLVQESEVRLSGMRDMPSFEGGRSRANYYGITGVVDVLSSVKINDAPSGNLILHHLTERLAEGRLRGGLGDQVYDVIVDYKGMRRPPVDSGGGSWNHHNWQVQTYSWLRERQHSTNPVAAAILFYLNELAPSKEDMGRLQKEVREDNTDIMPESDDREKILRWRKSEPIPALSTYFREARSIRVLPITEESRSEALQQFDVVVARIEGAVQKEVASGKIQNAWEARPEAATCTACDFKTFCPFAAPTPYAPRLPGEA